MALKLRLVLIHIINLIRLVHLRLPHLLGLRFVVFITREQVLHFAFLEMGRGLHFVRDELGVVQGRVLRLLQRELGVDYKVVVRVLDVHRRFQLL